MDKLRFTIIDGATSYLLDNSPIGWDDCFMKLSMWNEWFGMNTEYTNRLKFVKYGARILRTIYYTNNPIITNYPLYLKIEILDGLNLTYTDYKIFKFDFFTFKDSKNYVEINLVLNDLTQLLKKNINTTYTLPGLTPPYLWSECLYFDPNHTPSGMKVETLIQHLFDKITNGAYTLGTYDLSTTLNLNNVDAALFVVNGQCIRDQAYYPTISISFNDLLKSLNTIWDIGMGIEIIGGKETLVIVDDKSYFKNSSVIIENVGNIIDINMSTYQELLFGTMDLGYEKRDTLGSINTEFNYVNNYSFNINNANKLDFVSKIRASMSDVDYLINNNTYENWDYDLFFIMGYKIPPDDTYYPSATNLRKKYNPAIIFNVFNSFLSPYRCALRKQKYFDSLRLNQSIDIVWTGSNCDNINNQVLLNGVWTNEYSNISNNNSAFFYPIIFEFTAKFSKDFYLNYAANNKGAIEFIYNNTVFSGFILELEINPSKNFESKIKLLSSANNDITKLIQ